MQQLGRNTLLRSIFELAELHGVKRSRILNDIGLEPALANQAGAFVDSSKLIDAVEFAAIATGRNDFGLLLGNSQDHRSLGPIGLLVEHCRSVAEAVAEGSRYIHLHNSALLYTLTLDNNEYVFRLQLGTRGKYAPRHYVEALLTMSVRFCRVMLGADWYPNSVLFRHQRMARKQTYESIFGSGVEFEEEMNALSVCPVSY